MSSTLELNSIGRMELNATSGETLLVRPEHIIVVFQHNNMHWVTLHSKSLSVSIRQEEFDRLKSLGF